MADFQLPICRGGDPRPQSAIGNRQSEIPDVQFPVAGAAASVVPAMGAATGTRSLRD
jgi:hypothetical protein